MFFQRDVNIYWEKKIGLEATDGTWGKILRAIFLTDGLSWWKLKEAKTCQKSKKGNSWCGKRGFLLFSCDCWCSCSNSARGTFKERGLKYLTTLTQHCPGTDAQNACIQRDTRQKVRDKYPHASYWCFHANLSWTESERDRESDVRNARLHLSNLSPLYHRAAAVSRHTTSLQTNPLLFESLLTWRHEIGASPNIRLLQLTLYPSTHCLIKPQLRADSNSRGGSWHVSRICKKNWSEILTR